MSVKAIASLVGAIIAVMALVSTVAFLGYRALRVEEAALVETPKKLQAHDSAIEKIGDAISGTQKVLEKLSTQATLKDEKKKARQLQCQKLVDARKVLEKDCPTGRDERD